MGNRRKTPGLMEDLLSGKKTPADSAPKPKRQDASIPVKPQTEAVVPEPEPEVAPVQKSQPRKKSAFQLSYKKEEEKVKVTFYVSEDIQYSLDAAQLQIRREAPGHIKKQQLSKSAIVEAALTIVIDDLEREGEGSALAQYLFT